MDRPAIPSEGDIVVGMNYDRSITINTEPVSLDGLQERLRSIFATRANKVIFVRGQRDLDFQEIAAVIDIAKGAVVAYTGKLN